MVIYVSPLLFVTFPLLFEISYLLFVICYLLFVICYLLFVIQGGCNKSGIFLFLVLKHTTQQKLV
jgi:hypothetical protein